MEKHIKFTREFWDKWVKDPRGTAEEVGLDWNSAPKEWQSWPISKWQSMSQQQGQELLKNSKWSGWFWWE
jgi:hypothetical protein